MTKNYESPIEPLFGNIVTAFETANSGALQWLDELTKDGRLSKTIEITDRACYFPQVRRANADSEAVVELNILFLEQLWAFIYGWFVVYEECVQKELLSGSFHGVIEYSTALKRRAGQLLAWSGEFTKSIYPIELPSPTKYEQDEEPWVLKTNTIFSGAVSVILHHEAAHVRYGHLGIKANNSDLKQLENEADDVAHHEHLSQTSGEAERRIKGWSIIAPNLFSIWKSSRPLHLNSDSHPKRHHRLQTALGRLNFVEPKNRDYFLYLCFAVLSAYRQRYQSALEPSVFETTHEALETLLDEIDAGH